MPTDSKSTRILLIEDDDILSNLLLTQFKNNEIECLAVGSGEDALELLKADADFCTILLDISLPGIDGFEVLSKVKSDPRTADIPVIVASNFVQENDITWAKGLGMSQFISKVATTPIEIVDAVQTYCAVKASG